MSLLEEWGWGKFHCDPPIQGTMVWTKLTLLGRFSNSLQGEPVPMTILKKKKINPLMWKYTPAGLKQEEKAKLCLKSGRFDP